MSLGWRILPLGEYMIDLPRLSEQEEKLILLSEEAVKREAAEYDTRNESEKLRIVKETLIRTVEAEGLELDDDQKQ